MSFPIPCPCSSAALFLTVTLCVTVALCYCPLLFHCYCFCLCYCYSVLGTYKSMLLSVTSSGEDRRLRPDASHPAPGGLLRDDGAEEGAVPLVCSREPQDAPVQPCLWSVAGRGRAGQTGRATGRWSWKDKHVQDCNAGDSL